MASPAATGLTVIVIIFICSVSAKSIHPGSRMGNYCLSKEQVRLISRLSSELKHHKQHSESNAADSRQPSKCVFAIITCCPVENTDSTINDNCFEVSSCGGLFFGKSPCHPDNKRIAFEVLKRFYDSPNDSLASASINRPAVSQVSGLAYLPPVGGSKLNEINNNKKNRPNDMDSTLAFAPANNNILNTINSLQSFDTAISFVPDFVPSVDTSSNDRKIVGSQRNDTILVSAVDESNNVWKINGNRRNNTNTTTSSNTSSDVNPAEVSSSNHFEEDVYVIRELSFEPVVPKRAPTVTAPPILRP